MDRGRLNEALQIVKTFEDKATMPILSHVLIEQEQGSMTLTVSDLETSIRYRIYREDSEEWQLCVPVKKLHEIIKARGGEPSLYLGDDYKLHVGTSDGDVTIQGMDPTDFPTCFEEVEEEFVGVDMKDFLALETVIKAASRDRWRFNLDMISLADKKAVATDGHRIGTVKTPWLPEAWKLLVPSKELRKAIAAVKKVKKQVDQVELYCGEKNLSILAGPMYIRIRLSEGDYPDTSQFEADGPTAEVTTKELVNALKQVKIMTSNRNKSGTLNFREDRLELWSVHPDLGTAFTWIKADVQDELVGKAVLFNVEYMMQAARKCNGTVRITSNTAEKAPWSFGDELIMPMIRDHNDVTRPAIAPAIEQPRPEPRKVIPLRGWAAVTHRNHAHQDHGNYFNPAA